MRMLEQTSVIVPTYNRAGYLAETLESLLAQTLPPAEIIVADDGSTDDTQARVASFGERVRYFRKENSGKAATLNQALDMASHPLIWIMDDDDIALPQALEQMTALISGKPDIAIAYGRYDRFLTDPATGEQVRYHDGGYWRDVLPGEFLIATLQDFFVHHPGMLVRKTAYQAVGGFSLKYPRLEDYEMLVRLARAYNVAATREIVFLQRQHDGVRAGGVTGESARMARWRSEERELFEILHVEMPLAEFLPFSYRPQAGELSAAQRRQALIVRGAVMARKNLWNQAIEDLRAASEIVEAGLRLVPDERDALRQAFFSKYGCPEIVSDSQIARRLRALAQCGPTGAAIARAFGRSHFWFIRQALQQGKLLEAAVLSNRSVQLLLAR